MLLGAPAGAPTASAATGSISGTVTDGANPIAGATVESWRNDCCGGIYSTTTAANGTYTLAGVDDTSYRVRAYKAGFAQEWYDNAYTIGSATSVVVSGGLATNGINFALGAGGSVSGTVTNDSAVPIVGATVSANSFGCYCFVSATTGPGGTYIIPNLPPDSYTVGASAPGYAAKYYTDTYDPNTATSVAVSNSATTPGINLALALSATISGTITNGVGAPIANAEVSLAQASSSYQTSTNGSGVYSISGLPPVCFRVTAGKSGFAPEYYNNAYTQADATLVCPPAGGTVGNIHIALAPGGQINGTVTDGVGAPLQDVQVIARNADGECCDAVTSESAVTGANGTYVLGNMPPGTFIISFRKDGYLDEYYDSQTDVDLADPVGVTLSGTAPNINASLGTTGSISGRITNHVGAGVAGARVQASPYDCCRGTYGGATTAADGTYTITDLAPGLYRVAVTSAGIYATSRYYPGAYDSDAAVAVAVASRADTSAIDIALEPGASISGNVGAQGGEPVAGASVYAFCDGCGGFRSGTTASNGTYSVQGLPPGQYRLYAQAAGFVREYYNNVFEYSEATPVVADTGGNTPNINFTLSSGGAISGFVQDAYGAAIANATVYISGAPCCDDVLTAANGSFTVNVLAPGDHMLQVVAAGYVSEYYEDGYDFLQASPITVVDSPHAAPSALSSAR